MVGLEGKLRKKKTNEKENANDHNSNSNKKAPTIESLTLNRFSLLLLSLVLDRTKTGSFYWHTKKMKKLYSFCSQPINAQFSWKCFENILQQSPFIGRFRYLFLLLLDLLSLFSSLAVATLGIKKHFGEHENKWS